MKPPAVTCSRQGCARRTTDSSGACHDHRGTVANARAGQAPPPPRPATPIGPEPIRTTELEGYTLVECYRVGGRFHRLDGPARISRDEFSGELELEEWFVDGETHRDGGPATISYFGEVVEMEKWCRHGKVHRDDGPAVTRRPGSKPELEEWWVNGELSRIGAPARIEHRPGAEMHEFWVDGKRHRLTGPAEQTIARDGRILDEEWWLLGNRATSFNSFCTKLDFAPASRLSEAIEGSEFAGLLDVDLANRIEFVKAIRGGITTADGMREVLGGAPVEWVRSWEEGVSGSK